MPEHTLDELMANWHIGVYGPTGSGKSILVEHLWRRTTHVAVCFNVEEEPMPGITARTPRHIPELLAAGHEKILVDAPKVHSDDMVASCEELRDVLFDLGDDLKGSQRKTPHWCSVFFPEAQKYAPKMDKDGPVPDILQRGRKRGIHCVIDSQSPSAVSQVALTQARLRALFEFDEFELDYFRGYKVSVDEFQDHVREKYHWVLTKGAQWVPYRPVPFHEGRNYRGKTPRTKK